MGALATMHAGSFLSGGSGLDFEFLGLHVFSSLGCMVFQLHLQVVLQVFFLAFEENS